jgi:hypothetical protein
MRLLASVAFSIYIDRQMSKKRTKKSGKAERLFSSGRRGALQYNASRY